MPRILPRLLKKIESSPRPTSWEPFVLPRKKLLSLYRPVPPRPSFDASRRSTSILLDPPDTNPITNSRVYVRHKRLPPRPKASKRVDYATDTPQDAPRRMNEQELRWWSSPYLRMLASPIRHCIATGRYMPNDFLIRLASMRLPRSLNSGQSRYDNSQIYIPDGLLHPKFTARKSDKAQYILCNRSAIPFMKKHSAKRYAIAGIAAHPFLADQIAHLLRLRVLQELELLAKSMQDSVRKRKRTWTSRIIRRLSIAELNTIHETKTIPYLGAIAVIVAPPLPKDPATGKRPKPYMSDAPPDPNDMSTSIDRPLAPICVLHPVGPRRWDDKLGEAVLPEAQVPLYDGQSMFPVKGQRAALHAILLRLLRTERRFLHVDDPIKGEPKEKKHSSSAFLLTSDTETVLRGDVVAVAIALWRARMFDQCEEDVASQRTLGWEWTQR